MVPARAFIASLLLLPTLALAHGDYPESTALRFAGPQSPWPVVLTTYGFLLHEGPGLWSWVCEESISADGYPQGMAVTPEGYFVPGKYGLFRSDDGCSWEGPDLPGLAGLYVTQVSAMPGAPGRIFASTSTAGAENGIFVSDDGGRSFDLFKGFGPGTTVRGFLMGEGGAPFYVQVWSGGIPSLWHWEAGGEGEGDGGWIGHEILETGGGAVLPLGLDPEAPGVAYLRGLLPQGEAERLLRVSASGESEILLEVEGGVTLDAFAARGARLEVGGRDAGYLRSEDGGASWSAPDFSPQLGCLSYHGGRRFQCANNVIDPGAVLQGDPYAGEAAPLMSFGEVRGVKVCPAGSPVAQVCPTYWPSVKVLMGFDTGQPLEPPPPPEVTGCGGEAGPGEGTPALIFLPLLLALPRGRRRPRGQEAEGGGA